MAREEAMAQAIREGQPISQVMGANYEDMLKSRDREGAVMPNR
jgi:hypothetical protein